MPRPSMGSRQSGRQLLETHSWIGEEAMPARCLHPTQGHVLVPAIHPCCSRSVPGSRPFSARTKSSWLAIWPAIVRACRHGPWFKRVSRDALPQHAVPGSEALCVGFAAAGIVGNVPWTLSVLGSAAAQHARNLRAAAGSAWAGGSSSGGTSSWLQQQDPEDEDD